MPNPVALLHQIQGMQTESIEQLMVIPNSHGPLRSQQRQGSEVWRPPLNDMVKVNLDASFLKEQGLGCSRVIIINNKGEVLLGLTRNFHASSSLQAEAEALRDVVNLAHNMDLGKVIFECDNLELVKSCRREIISGEIQHLVQGILWYKDKFRHFGLTWVHRKGNEVAHHLVALNCRGLLPVKWRWNMPVSLKALLENDFKLQIQVPND